MASVQTLSGDRVQTLCERFYGAVTADGLTSITLANPDWDGDGVYKGDEIVSVPDEVFVPPYNPDVIAPELRRQLGLETRVNLPPLETADNMSSRTGAYVDEEGAVRADVYHRALTHMGTRAYRPGYSTLVLNGLHREVDGTLLNDLVTQISVALAPASDRYTVDSIQASIQDLSPRDGIADDILIEIVVIPRYTTKEIPVRVPIYSGGGAFSVQFSEEFA